MADDYGDDFEADVELESQKKSGGLSLLRSAAAEVEKEEKEEVQAALRESADEMKGIAKLLGDSDRQHDAEAKGGDVEEEEDDVSLDGDEDEDPEANSALRIACNKGNLTKVRSILDKGTANMKARDRHGWTSLHWACKGGHTDIIDYLVEHVGTGDRYAFINAKDSISGWTPLMLGCMTGKEETVRSLISHGAKTNKHNKMMERAVDFVPATCKARREINKLLGVKDDEKPEGESKEAK